MRHLPIPILDDAIVQRFLSFVKKDNDCWIWTGAANSCGRATFTIRDKSYVSARVMYKLHHNVDPENDKVCHTCDNPLCVNPEHLWLGTQIDNIKDRDSKERQNRPVGERNPCAFNSGAS
jgi:hypothetical protein